MYASEFLSEKNIKDNLTDIKHFGYDTTFNELQFRRGQIAYDRLCDGLATIDKQVDYRKLPKVSLEELKQLALEVYDQLFNCDYHDLISTYSRMVELIDMDEPFDAITAHDIYDEVDCLKQIFISDKCSIVEASSLAHEYMHALLLKYNTSRFNDVISNYHYEELLPMIIEYLTSSYVDTIYKGVKDYNSLIRLRTNAVNVKDQKNVELMLREHRDAVSGFKDMIEYQSHNQFTYIICDMYASYLASLDSKDVANSMRSIINGESSINDAIIKKYNLSLTNRDLVEHYYQKMN